MLPSPEELVAQYLRARGYDQTLIKFIEEAELKPDAGSNGGITIEQLLEEKKTFDLSLTFERLGTDDVEKWHIPAPANATILGTLPTKSNIISSCMLDMILPGHNEPRQYIAATTADRRLNLIDPLMESFPLIQSYSHFLDSPLLDVVIVSNKFLLAGSMSGKLTVYNTATDKVTDVRKDHSKYIVKISTWSNAESTIVASAGWDAKIHLYKLNTTDGDNAQLGKPLAILTLQTIPETIVFIGGTGTLFPVLLVTRRDSTLIYYYEVTTSASDTLEVTLLGTQNLAPHSNAWVVFSPSDVQLCPTDPSKAAIATASTPHMKLLIVRLLVPPSRQSTGHFTESGTEQGSASPSGYTLGDGNTEAPLTQAAQARAQLLVQDREEAAILVNINTMAPQTAYSTPRLAWRPDGSGIFVTSDDGVVRGFEASTGKLVVGLGAHDTGSKVRCLWAGYMQGEADRVPAHEKKIRECLISGGFDQKLIIWETAPAETIG